MDITRYQILLKVIERGSFTRAAEEMGFTQSTVSHAIQTLETEMGLPLLIRNRSGVTLTADGHALLPYITELCHMQHRIEEVAIDLRGLEAGLVRLAAFTSVSVQWLPHILKSFQEKYPAIEFEILPGDYNQIEQWVAEGRADCGFLRLPSLLDLDVWLLHQDQLRVILPFSHPLAGKEPFPREALAELPFIRLDEGGDNEIGAVFDDLRIRPNIRYTVKDDQTLLAMVSNGLGISVLPELMIRNSPFPVVQCRLEKAYSRNIGICIRDKYACSASTRRFIEHTQRWVTANYGV